MCLMRELVVPRVINAECLAVSADPLNSHRAWVGGGSSARRLGSITAVHLDGSGVTTQVFKRNRMEEYDVYNVAYQTCTCFFK